VKSVRVGCAVRGVRWGTNGPMLEFACPRCSDAVSEEYYGPCTSCRTTLRAVMGNEGREVVSAGYEPKMNVTPNAVATKD